MNYQYCVIALSENSFSNNLNGGNTILNQLVSTIESMGSIEQFSILDNSTKYSQRFGLTSLHSFGELKDRLNSIADELKIDLVIKPWADRQIKPKLLIMDMDSTLVQAETIDEIARVAGVGDKVAEITESAMRGELDFTESLHARVSMLEGVSIHAIAEVHNCLPLTEGAKNLLARAAENGCHTALVSGGFTLFAKPIATSLGFNTLSANVLEEIDGKLTGKVIGDIVDGNSKRETLKRLQKKLAITTQEIVAIGDGANDLPMLTTAGTGIAYHAKPRVQEQASAKLNNNNLNAVCWLLDW